MRIAPWPLLLLPLSALAAPFSGGNPASLARQAALPDPAPQAVLDPGRVQWTAAVDIANEYAREKDADEDLEFDGESRRLRLGWRRGLGAGWEAGIEVPLLSTGGGALDSWIEDWHQSFGLPNGGREQVPQDRYRYRYSRGGNLLLDVDTGGSGLGDIALGLGRSLGGACVLRGLLKLPTGDAARLLGGTAGAAVWLDIGALPEGRAAAAVSAGVAVNGRSDVLPDQQVRTIPFGALHLQLPVTARVSLQGRVLAHAAPYRGSDLHSLSRPGAPSSLGLRLRTRSANFDFGFQEDPAVYASPDFTLYLAVSGRR